MTNSCDRQFNIGGNFPARTDRMVGNSGGVTFAVRTHGRSMVNKAEPLRSIGENSIVKLRRVNAPSVLKWVEVYAIATDDGCIIKMLMPCGDGKVRCVSCNSEEYPEFTLSGEQIHDLAEVVAVLNCW